ncbi:MAG: glycosyltransferase [Nitrospirae bacterium]|nr:glycosyltransferase [Nitrospirota bacterium]
MATLISIVIPNRNGETTIARCLEAALASRYPSFEVIVVDDASEDRSVEIIQRFPCKLIRLETHAGAARARNVGARHSQGEILFFTDADCLLQEDALSLACETLRAGGPHLVVGGTYTPLPYDRRFFSIFQSVFIHHAETKRAEDPDYLATHALAIPAEIFRAANGFTEEFLPILEDVELSHRLRRTGHHLAVNPRIQVRHIFNFTLAKSLRNAFRKALYWTRYSLGNRNLLADSGTASTGLKINVAIYALSLLLLGLSLFARQALYLLPVLPLLALNLWANRGLVRAFYRAQGTLFAFAATLYYLLLYPAAVGAGSLAGLSRYLWYLSRQNENIKMQNVK